MDDMNNTENVDNLENTKNVENIENIENIENNGNVENIENSEFVDNTESAGNTTNIQDSEELNATYNRMNDNLNEMNNQLTMQNKKIEEYKVMIKDLSETIELLDIAKKKGASASSKLDASCNGDKIKKIISEIDINSNKISRIESRLNVYKINAQSKIKELESMNTELSENILNIQTQMNDISTQLENI